MNNTIRAALLALIFLNLPSESQAQFQGPSRIPASAPSIGFGSLGTLHPPGHQPQAAVQPVSFCEGCGGAPGNCGCGDGFTYSSPCSGACGGVCAGGCGDEPGLFGGLLSGLGSGLGGGAGSGGGGFGSCLGLNGGWLDVEYLLWWNKDRYIPALATTSPTGTALADAGVLGQPDTSILFGDELINGSPHSGVRVSSGMWLEPRQTIGIGSRYTWIDGEVGFSASSAGDPILARPFFDSDPLVNAQASLMVAYPGVSSGSIDVTASNAVRGYDIYLRKLLLSGYCNRLDVIGGYHNSRVKDSVDIRHSFTDLDGSRVPIDGVVSTQDFFEVENQFHGGFIGLMSEAADGPLSWSMMAKVAFGNMNQEARINGSTTSSVPGAGSATTPIGLLALPSNIGTFDQDEFAIVPELNVSVRYNLNSRMQVLLGYSFIYWSEVALSGDMIDLNVNTSQLTGPLVGSAQPSASLKSDGFWYTGLSVGGSIRF